MGLPKLPTHGLIEVIRVGKNWASCTKSRKEHNGLKRCHPNLQLGKRQLAINLSEKNSTVILLSYEET
ncbi:hypothetical protein KIN20_035642 [Parelaphostrongylus tenuis]|uniref:Uncharacterized protein n=1 Tax=Parelaphostrongylus tenuis TaxID=148309 RepID=A0AAD5WL17_PARTN|nr:hypothetical protein KIN20_035642 [Parelaphostrongylus tenuis]